MFALNSLLFVQSQSRLTRFRWQSSTAGTIRWSSREQRSRHGRWNIYFVSPAEETCPTDLINIGILVTEVDLQFSLGHKRPQYGSPAHGLIIRDTCFLATSIGLDVFHGNISSFAYYPAGHRRPASTHSHLWKPSSSVTSYCCLKPRARQIKTGSRCIVEFFIPVRIWESCVLGGVFLHLTFGERRGGLLPVSEVCKPIRGSIRITDQDP